MIEYHLLKNTVINKIVPDFMDTLYSTVCYYIHVCNRQLQYKCLAVGVTFPGMHYYYFQEKYLKEHIKVKGKVNNLGTSVTVESTKHRVSVSTEVSFTKK